MEQQTVSIAKAGITTVLSTRCSVLAAANPSFGSYDDSKETSEQHDFESTILSRFDLIWVIRDERNVERDRRIAGQVVDLFSVSGQRREYPGHQTRGQPFGLARRAAAVLHYLLPKRMPPDVSIFRGVNRRLSNEAVTRLGNFYVQVREELRSDARKRRDQIPITIRQLESLVRLSESVAKMSLTREVSSAHVEAAIALFRSSTVEAAKSHIGRETLTGEELENLKAAEQAILDRLPMNSRSSKRRIIADLRTRGLDPYHVGRALRVLVTKGLVQIRGDSTVYRGAE
ncbi:MAG: uncharacterized protein KVP18_002869 [Porospora cf. gigantea A]|uniref:uncharacterized protein n=1 Tax=Porospora cf. gigantea A TaxID=2853593 RepID=UPI00355939E8|nr:MAG: hypothetical protein KVP18_002869 [Porospora cf. gigantea A]